MDQEADYENFEEEPRLRKFPQDQITVAPPLESAFAKYLREYRLLNSLLISLVMILGTFVAMWNIVVYVAAAGEGDADFSDAGTPRSAKSGKEKSSQIDAKAKKGST